jgi:hypothetical protein
MRYILNAVAVSGLLLFGLTANVQYQPRGDAGYQDREEFRDRERARFFDRVRADLDRAEATSLPFTDDRARIVRAREEVNAVLRKLEAASTTGASSMTRLSRFSVWLIATICCRIGIGMIWLQT